MDCIPPSGQTRPTQRTGFICCHCHTPLFIAPHAITPSPETPSHYTWYFQCQNRTCRHFTTRSPGSPSSSPSSPTSKDPITTTCIIGLTGYSPPIPSTEFSNFELSCYGCNEGRFVDRLGWMCWACESWQRHMGFRGVLGWRNGKGVGCVACGYVCDKACVVVWRREMRKREKMRGGFVED
ncbi:hypothetical protein EX30DRAFT_4576 [Ascodesmis nigricans]|uniref:Uncharacterized protein n=1 Tax=Ascodesmis nigricans TaxID=341454 RepID=A0A4S2N5V3_9PEZI|nr:hypothetical protein EX30DRAFT_4576 [Ascodesmis nigricans]